MTNPNITDKLYTHLAATHVEVIDDSWRHAGHAAMSNVPEGQQTHIRVVVVSDQFKDVPLLNRHRMVHALLKENFETHLHALELKTYSCEEWAQL